MPFVWMRLSAMANIAISQDGCRVQPFVPGLSKHRVGVEPLFRLQGSEVPGSGGGYCTHKRTHNVPMARKNGEKWGKMGENGGKMGKNGEN